MCFEYEIIAGSTIHGIFLNMWIWFVDFFVKIDGSIEFILPTVIIDRIRLNFLVTLNKLKFLLQTFVFKTNNNYYEIVSKRYWCTRQSLN